MSQYIIRLDDACPNMNPLGWIKMEQLLDTYNIRPLVGIIPDNRDPSFQWEPDPSFWTDTVCRWKSKQWSLAQHGTHHAIYKATEKGEYSEFRGKSIQEQKELIDNGYQLLLQHQITPSCFFAPCHSYDRNTFAALKELGYYQYISDGYAFKQYHENGLVFLPNLFDTPHKLLPFGTYTFVFHPNHTTDAEFKHLEEFLIANKGHFVSADDYIKNASISRKRNLAEKAIEPSINLLRKIRSSLKRT